MSGALRLARFTLAAAALAGAGACAKPSVEQEAMSLARRHREDEAVARLRAAIAEEKPGTTDVEARALLVRMLAFAGDAKGAEREAEALAKRLPPDDPRAWIELGHAREIGHDFEGALAAYDEAARVAPSSPAGPREGGLRAARWGEVEEAGPRLAEATRRDARDVEAWHALGLVRVHLGDLDGADAAYRACLAVDARSGECWLGIATVAVKRGDAERALLAYDALAKLRPTWASAELGRAWALAKLGRRDEARAAIEHAEQLGAGKDVVARQRAALDVPPDPR